jgi:endonuclease YncB( thermonuclease family)
MRLFAALAVSLIASSVCAADCPAGAREPVRAVSVGDRLEILLGDGRLVYFPALEPPRASAAEPDRVRATAAQVQALLADKVLMLQKLGVVDRWGRAPVRLFLPDMDESLDEILLGAGLAQRGAGVAPCPEGGRIAEEAARAAGLGVWSDPAFAVLSGERPEDFAAREGALAVVEGRVASIGRTVGRLYLNFGAGRGGFFATIARRNWLAFERTGFSESSLRSRKLRLRGIVESGAGPHMELFHPEQIEFMDEPPQDAAKAFDPKF